MPKITPAATETPKATRMEVVVTTVRLTPCGSPAAFTVAPGRRVQPLVKPVLPLFLSERWRDGSHKRPTLEEVEEPKRLYRGVVTDLVPVLKDIKLAMPKSDRLKKFVRNPILQDIGPHPFFRNCGLDSVEVRQAPHDLANHAHDPFIAAWENLPTLTGRSRDRDHLLKEIAETPCAVDLRETATRFGRPEFLHRRIRLSRNKQHVSEVRLVVRPPAIAPGTSENRHPLHRGGRLRPGIEAGRDNVLPLKATA